MFLVSSGVDWVRRGAADGAQLNPFDPTMGEMIQNVIASGSDILVCPPCSKVRGYKDSDLIDEITITGSAALHELVKQGAETLSF